LLRTTKKDIMPTLDDAPTIETLAGDDLTSSDVSDAVKIARADLVQVFDVSEQKVKTISVQELGEALGVTFS
tara:strand:+ start:733 stop:948 length:216 start_codon:yes stop_codon:yes gene_type:complete